MKHFSLKLKVLSVLTISCLLWACNKSPWTPLQTLRNQLLTTNLLTVQRQMQKFRPVFTRSQNTWMKEKMKLQNSMAIDLISGLTEC